MFPSLNFSDFILNLKWDLYDLRAGLTHHTLEDKIKRVDRMIKYIDDLKLEDGFKDKVFLSTIQSEGNALLRGWQDYRKELTGE